MQRPIAKDTLNSYYYYMPSGNYCIYEELKQKTLNHQGLETILVLAELAQCALSAPAPSTHISAAVARVTRGTIDNKAMNNFYQMQEMQALLWIIYVV